MAARVDDDDDDKEEEGGGGEEREDRRRCHIQSTVGTVQVNTKTLLLFCTVGWTDGYIFTVVM